MAQLLEVHAAPLEVAQIRADHGVVHAADGCEQFGEGHEETSVNDE